MIWCQLLLGAYGRQALQQCLAHRSLCCRPRARSDEQLRDTQFACRALFSGKLQGSNTYYGTCFWLVCDDVRDGSVHACASACLTHATDSNIEDVLNHAA